MTTDRIAACVVQGGRAGADLLADRRIQDLETAKLAVISLIRKSLYPEAQIVFEERLPAPGAPSLRPARSA